MTLNFIKQLNEYIIESILETNDKDTLKMVGTEGYPTWEQIKEIDNFIEKIILEKRKNRLNDIKNKFIEYKNNSTQLLYNQDHKSVQDMLTDIVKAIQNTDRIPNGLLMAFREKGHESSDNEIKEIWETLLKLQLIDTSDRSDKNEI